MEPYLSKQQCGFRKGYSTQVSLSHVNKMDGSKGKYPEVLLTNLPEVFDYLLHDLLQTISH